MSDLTWSESFSVGVSEIDKQHRRLFAMINQFQTLADARDPEAPRVLLLDLMDYMLTHFRTEEAYFKQFGYPEADSHIREHQAFEDRIAEIRTAYQQHGTLNSRTVMEFLKEWIIQHILVVDKKYAACFRENGLG